MHSSRGSRLFKKILHLAYLMFFLFYLFLLLDGYSYYRTPLLERPHHPRYRELRPAGFRGHGLGIVGSFLMIIMLSYSLRKRVKFFRKWGPLSHWLDFHIFCGIVGPLLVVLHTSFKVQGLVAVSFWSMIAVALSGVLGRYLYLKIPRNVQGEMLSLKEISALGEQLNQKLQEQFSLQPKELGLLEEAISELIPPARGGGQGLIALFWDDLRWPWLRRRYEALLARRMQIPQAQLKPFVTLLRDKARLQRKIVVLQQVQQLFHYWHVFHKPFALIMYLIMLVHIGVAVWLGYTWIF